jgi:hypothetical protein
LAIEDRLLSSDHPKRAHRRNNLAMVCMLANRLDESESLNREAWAHKTGQHDVTSGRILFLRIALCWLLDADASLYLGQLRTLLAQPNLTSLGGVDRQWEAADILDELSKRLTTEKAGFLRALVLALNEPGKIAQLDRFSLWLFVLDEPLDAPWPEKP